MSGEEYKTSNNWVMTDYSSTFETSPSSKINHIDYNEYDKLTSSSADLGFDVNNTNALTLRPKLSKKEALSINKPLTAETIRVLSEINVDEMSLSSQFDLLFNDISMLRASAVSGTLGATSFRFLAWMIFLECIPMDKSKWITSISKNRHIYDRIKHEFNCNPREESGDQENFDHPLSTDDDSTWKKYFDHIELKSVIIQDVIRLNEHSEFLSLQSTKDLIIHLLFIYVKFTNSEYRQGMHEILACIMYVLYEEYSKLSNLNETNDFIKEVVDLKYIEHDAYTIFHALMTTIHEWFGISTARLVPSFEARRSSCLDRRNSLILNPKLFQEIEEFYENEIMNKINYITNVILKDNDSEVFNHLNQIHVTLHPFGIRWLRLLYIRELEFPSCLILWDAIFATDNKELSLVNYIFVSLLTCLREEILRLDNSGCMHLLMQSHSYLKPIDVLKTALYLQNPGVYKRPLCMENSYEIISPLNKLELSPGKSQSQPNLRATLNNETDRNNNSNTLPKQPTKLNQPSKNEFDYKKAVQKRENESDFNAFPKSSSNRKTIQNEFALDVFSMQGLEHNKDLLIHFYIDKIQELQKENESLKAQLSECADNMKSFSNSTNDKLGRLLEKLKEFPKNDEIVALAEDLKKFNNILEAQSSPYLLNKKS